MTQTACLKPTCLQPDDIRRLLFSLIKAEQDRLEREGRLSAPQRLEARLGPRLDPRIGAAEQDTWGTLMIDEEGLGFDSLARLDLVMCVNRFFDLSSTGIEDYLLVHRGLSDWVSLVGQHLEMVGTAAQVTFSSSGSTGPQTHSPHGLAALDSEVAAHLQGPLAGWDRTGRILCPLPVHHIYGFLWGVLLPARAGAGAIDLPSGLPGPVLRSARAGDLVLSTPFGWSRLAAAGRALPEGVTGVSSGGPTTPETWQAARQLGLARLIEVYGSSETAGLGWRDDPEQPLTLFSDIRHTDQGLMRPRSPSPSLTLQDHLDWVDSTRFHVRGRKDCVVQVGGVNVSLDHVRQHLCALPGVADAAVRLDGERIKSFVVSDAADTETLERALRRHLHSLPAPARPDRFTFGRALPRSDTGKLRDW
jgi:4-coumarate--CoA ligase